VGVGEGAARLKLTPLLPPYARVAPLVIDRVGIIVDRLIPETESSETVYSDTVAFPADRNRLTLDDISITMDAPSEDLLVTLQLLSGTTLLFEGSQTVTVVRGQRTGNTVIPVFYQGPGNNLTSLVLGPRDTVVQPGATVDFRLDAFDVSGAPVPQYYAGWSLTGGAASSAGINAVGRLTASSVNDTFYVKVAAPNGVLDSTLVVVASSTTPPTTTLTWTGAVSTDWSVAGNWSPAQVPGFLDSVVIGTSAAQRQPSLSEVVVTGSVSIVTGGNLTIAGQAISIVRGLTTGGTGVLTMTDPADVVVVQGDAVFDGGNELDLMSAGGLSIGGNLTQRATNSGDSFHPSGTHVTLLAGATPTLSFATPGLVPGTSHFQLLAWIGTGTLTLATPVMAHDEMVVESQGASIIASSNGSRLTVSDLFAVGPLAFNNAPLALSTTTNGALSLANITFQNMPTTVSQLTVSHPGGSFTFTNLVFNTTPVAPNGFYLDVTDNTGPTDGGLVIDMENPTPATPGAFVQTNGGAVVNWPSGTIAVRLWNGAVSTNWSAAGNWIGGVVPGPADSVVIPSAVNQPVLTTGTSVGAVNVTSGTLTVAGQLLTVARTFATTGTGTLTMTNPLDALLVQGNVLFAGDRTDGLLTNGTIAVGGSFTQQGGTSPLSFAATSPHTVRFDGPSAFVTFATPGLAASRFGNLRQGNANNGFSPGSDIALGGDLLGPTSTLSTFFTANNFALTVTRAFNCCVTLDGMTLVLDDPTGQTAALNGITFITLDNALTQLTVRHPGGATPLTLTGIGWQTLAAGNTGSYIDATDVNGATGGTLTVDVISNDPGNGPTFTKVSGGALVFWPGTPVQWTGSVSTDWFIPGNWNSLRVPFQNITSIPAGTPNAPVVTGLNANVRDLTVAAGATLTLQTSGSLTASGNVNAAGSIVTTGSTTIGLTGTGGALSGNLGNTVVSGSYALNGDVVVAAGASVQVQGTLALGGRRLRTENLTVSTTGGLLVMTSPNDSLIVSNGLVFQGGDETGQLTAGVIALQGGMTVAAFIPNHFVASGTHKVVLNGARTQAIGFAATTSSRFQNLEIAITGGFPAVLNASTVTVAGDLSVTSGQLTPSGRRLNVGGNFAITGAGVLNMTNAGDSLFITGSATFAGGSTATTLTNGVLRVVGDFTQSAVTHVASFSPSGVHKTVLGGAGVSDVSMGSPDLGANGSHFQVLDVSPATGGIILDVNMQADSLISTAAAATISGPLVALTARRVQVSGLTFQNTRFILDEQGVAETENFSNVTFNGYPGNSTDLTLLTVIGPGGAAAARPAVTTNSVNFLTLPVGGNNFYVDLTSSNGFAFVMTMTGSNQGRGAGGNGETLWQGTPATGVAVVNWP